MGMGVLFNWKSGFVAFIQNSFFFLSRLDSLLLRLVSELAVSVICNSSVESKNGVGQLVSNQSELL